MDIVVFSGTSEGRKISEYLSRGNIVHDVCVATESGEAVMDRNNFANVHVGRLDEDEIRDYFHKVNPKLVVDATHPYAKVVTDNLKKVCTESNIQYVRVNRKSSVNDCEGNANSYESAKKCAEALCSETGNILLATGSKELSCYTSYKELKDRLFVRVLPSIDAIELCKKADINEKHIIAMYGPHTREMNEAVLRQYNICHMVTKESGQAGGYIEKIEACNNVGVKLHVIERPDNAEGISINECIKIINNHCHIRGEITPKLNVSLVGIGPGNSNLHTKEAENAIKMADYAFGANRMLDSVATKAVKIAEYMPDKIIEKLEDIISLESEKEINDEINVVALFSGDTGIYSGATKLYRSLNEWGKCDQLITIPGISSFSAMAAAININYQDAHFESLHGKAEDKDNQNRIRNLISQGEKTFILMSGKEDFNVLINLIEDNTKEVIIGRNLSYNEGQIIYTNANKLISDISNVEDGLFIVVINAGNN